MGRPRGSKNRPKWTFKDGLEEVKVTPNTEARSARSDNARPASPKVEARASQPPAKPSWSMKAGNNWETARETDSAMSPFHIPESMIPPGMSLQWNTETVYGERQTRRINKFYSEGGWTPVHYTDFDGLFEQYPRDESGFISEGGQILCARPLELTIAAKKRDKRKADEQIALKAEAFKGGEINATGANHPSALASNRINRTMERLDIPKD